MRRSHLGPYRRSKAVVVGWLRFAVTMDLSVSLKRVQGIWREELASTPHSQDQQAGPWPADRSVMRHQPLLDSILGSIKAQQIENLTILQRLSFQRLDILKHGAGKIEVFLLNSQNLRAILHLKDRALLQT